MRICDGVMVCQFMLYISSTVVAVVLNTQMLLNNQWQYQWATTQRVVKGTDTIKKMSSPLVSDFNIGSTTILTARSSEKSKS